jgi:glycosyltransferase involved in cell wall biosynthesis
MAEFRYGGEGRSVRILLIANTLPDTDISGVGEQVLQLATGLEARGHEVEVLSRASGGLGRLKLLFPLTVAPRCVRVLTRFRPHVVQVHESDGALAALLTVTLAGLLRPSPRLAGLLQVSYVEEWRSVRALTAGSQVLGRPGWSERRFKWFKAPLQIALGLLTVYLCDVVMAPSRRTASELERDYLARRVDVLPNVMGGRVVAEEPGPAAVASQGFLLYVGRLRIRKAVEVLLESLRQLGDSAPRLLIVGDGEHRSRLERRVEHLGLGHRVEFLGRRSPGQVRSLMRQAAALVVPSIYEGMPLVILEAMERALPVIATAVSGIPEVVEDGVTGWLVEPEDSVALAAAVRDAMSRPEERHRRGEAGRLRLSDRFAPGRAAERWSEIVVERGDADRPESDASNGGQE